MRPDRLRPLLAAIAVALPLAGATAAAENEKVDPRAVEECARRGAGFVEINACLPVAHVAVITLDAIAEIFGPPSNPLIVRCKELNPEIEAAAGCVTGALDSAVQLKKRLPEEARIPDPLFDPLADEEKVGAVRRFEEDARKSFPEITLWAPARFRPYSSRG